MQLFLSKYGNFKVIFVGKWTLLENFLPNVKFVNTLELILEPSCILE